jgi:hypothetical protein
MVTPAGTFYQRRGVGGTVNGGAAALLLMLLDGQDDGGGLFLGHGNGGGVTVLIVDDVKEEEQQLKLGVATLTRLRRGRTSRSIRPRGDANITATARGWHP